MKLKKIIYISRATLPKRQPHNIQVFKTCASFAKQGAYVTLYVKRNKFRNIKDAFEYFGLQTNENIQIKTVPPLLRRWVKWHALFVSLRFLFKKTDAVFYSSNHKVAVELLRLRWLHRMPVFVELHTLPENVMNMNEISTLTGFKLLLSHHPELTDIIHKYADGLIFAHKATKTITTSSRINTPMIHAWFATEPIENHTYSFSKRTGIYYVGNFQKCHQMDILFKAMKYVEGEKLILVGGNNKDDISRTMDYAKNTGVAEKIVFNGYAEPKEIKNLLKTARVGVMTTSFGIKLTDYLSAGIPIIAPDHPLVKEILHDGEDCVLFQHGNPESLASAINKVLGNPSLAETMARNAYKTAQEYTWQKRAEKILNFIEDNM